MSDSLSEDGRSRLRFCRRSFVAGSSRQALRRPESPPERSFCDGHHNAQSPLHVLLSLRVAGMVPPLKQIGDYGDQAEQRNPRTKRRRTRHRERRRSNRPIHGSCAGGGLHRVRSGRICPSPWEFLSGVALVAVSNFRLRQAGQRGPGSRGPGRALDVLAPGTFLIASLLFGSINKYPQRFNECSHGKTKQGSYDDQ